MIFALAISTLLWICTVFGLSALALQAFSAWLHARKAPKTGTTSPGITILKPLCGVDDDLAVNLEQFAQLPYPNYELILGVKNEQDAAFPVAQEYVRLFPERVRLVLQKGEAGLNPKVNQLVGMMQQARHDLIIVSDSNVRVPDGYLDEIAALFEDPEVACITNPIVGVGEKRLGSLMDNLHLGASIAAGMIAAKMVGGQDIVVGKSMGLRRSALVALGGFEAARNHLAEDYVLGGRVRAALGKKVAVCRLPVYNVSLTRSVKDFFNRYIRWSIIHRTSIAPLTYFGQSFLNPLPIALAAFAFHPTLTAGEALIAVCLCKAWVDLAITGLLRKKGFGWVGPIAVLLKDILIAAAWWNGVFARTVVWRGNRLRVTHGSRLVLPDGSDPDLVLPTPGTAPVQPAPAWAREGSDRSVA